MSGHSKWSTIKHKKAVVDAKRGNVFTKMAAAITVAVRTGGGVSDTSSNFSLRLAVERARAVNMPKENIERAIAKGMGHGGAAEIAELTLEGYGPYAVALVIEVVTDSRNRTTSEIKNILEKSGGRLGEPGSVLYQFDRVGEITTSQSVDEAMELSLIDQGILDVSVSPNGTVVYTTMGDMQKVVEYLEKLGFPNVSGTLIYRSNMTKELAEDGHATVEALLSALRDYDDVQEVYANIVS